MAREHARILTRIWKDPDWRSLPAGPQRLYLLLISQPSINNAGVLYLTLRRWSTTCAENDSKQTESDLATLEDKGFVIVDEETEEVLVRSFMRNDGVAKQPKILKNACAVAVQVDSGRIREQLAVELRRIDTPDANATADTLDPLKHARPLRLTPSPPEADTEATESLAEGNPLTTGAGEGVSVTEDGSRSVTTDVSSDEADASSDSDDGEETETVEREDVEALCRHLADRVVANGSKRPTITDKWRREARLLIDRDKREVDKIHALIDWCQDHYHWRTRVMAMPKFRAEYDSMRLQAISDFEKQRGRSADTRPSASDSAAARAQALRRQPRQPAPPREPEQTQLPAAGGF